MFPSTGKLSLLQEPLKGTQWTVEGVAAVDNLTAYNFLCQTDPISNSTTLEWLRDRLFPDSIILLQDDTRAKMIWEKFATTEDSFGVYTCRGEYEGYVETVDLYITGGEGKEVVYICFVLFVCNFKGKT